MAPDAVDEGDRVQPQLLEPVGVGFGLEDERVQGVGERLDAPREFVGRVHDGLGGGEQLFGLGRLVVRGRRLEAGVDVLPAVPDARGLRTQAGRGLLQLAEVTGVLGYPARFDHVGYSPPRWPGFWPTALISAGVGAFDASRWARAAMARSPSMYSVVALTVPSIDFFVRAAMNLICC
ncbi:hypothetical protein EES42_07040 [Streptomyces sp. ADI95-17]|nr:hypothetical protein EES42_07040 [Streptomyces sp. ADI95-17]